MLSACCPAKCAGFHVFESCQARSESQQLCVGTKSAESASQVLLCLIDSGQAKENVILKIDYKALSIRKFELQKTFELHPEVKYSPFT